MCFCADDVQLDRCIALIKSNPAAARQLFRYASQMMGIDDTGKYSGMVNVLKFCTPKGLTYANSSDPDQAAPKEQSDQGLYCLPFN